jgi:tripartite-type tricarboxylate transporter receptor subunit TctC
MEVFKSRTGIAARPIPYAGNPQVINAIIAGELQMALLPPGLADVQIKAGKLKAIGTTSLQRSPLVPEVPTLGEVGVPDFQIEIWTSAAAPASMPPTIVARLSSLIGSIARSPEVGDKLFQHGYAPVGSSSEQLGIRLKADTELLSGIIASRGIRVE